MIVWRWNICKEEVYFVDEEEDIVSDNALVWCVALRFVFVEVSESRRRRR